jgi:pimeloyl-ACP methyl ester carboxylesterase
MIVHDKHRIFYRFEGEKGAFLLLHHGLFGSHRDWYEAGYVEALAGDFRLIIPDARGHGRSDHPLDPARYRLEDLSGDVVGIMDDLDIRNLHFFGYGLGALVGFDLLRRHPERLRITMLGGEAPFVTPPLIAEWEALAGRIRAAGLAAALRRLHGEERLVSLPDAPEGEGEQQAALALLEALAATPPEEGEGRISFNSPLALFTGEHDPALQRIQEGRKRIHRARFVSLAGQGHAGLFRQREALLEEVLRLLRSGRRKGDSAEGAEDSGRIDRQAGERDERGGPGSRRRTDPRAASPPDAEPPEPIPPPDQRTAQPSEQWDEPEGQGGEAPPSPATVAEEPAPSEPDFPQVEEAVQPPEAHDTGALSLDAPGSVVPETSLPGGEETLPPMGVEITQGREGGEAGDRGKDLAGERKEAPPAQPAPGETPKE